MSRLDITSTERTEKRAKIAITVDLGEMCALDKDRSHIKSLVQLIGDHHFPVTWAVDSAKHLPWVAPLQNGSDKQDIAMIVADSWASPEGSQNAFRDQLSRRLEAFQREGITPTAVLIRSTCNARSRLGPLAQHGLATVLADASHGRARRNRHDVAPRPIPWGLWELSTNVNLPTRNRWLRFAFSMRLPKSGRTSTASSGMHGMIHAQQIAAQGRGAMQQVRQFLHKVAWARSARNLDVVTAADWTATAAENSTVRPQRSILRIAA